MAHALWAEAWRNGVRGLWQALLRLIGGG